MKQKRFKTYDSIMEIKKMRERKREKGERREIQ